MSLPMNSLYSLTWGDYGTSLVSAVQLLRCHGDLVDCTLAAGGRSFPAHKIVLCAASPFLLDLLKNTPCKHPIVMLAGVNANDLEALLEFVYRGEVSVDHSQLPSLLQAAHCLNIQGLAPQTVSKDDYTTSIQLHPSLLPQHHVKTVIDVGNGNMVNMNDYTEELITTIEESPHHQTVHAHVVEEIIHQEQHPLTAEVVTDVKDVINQFLPTRKRKPRTKKPAIAKIPKIDENNVQAITPIAGTTTATTTTTTATTQTLTMPSKKMENVENFMTTTTTPTSTATPATPTSTKAAKNDPLKPKSRSQSEQPASCPICNAVIRQSRNLRRHLELRHFSKGVKKEQKLILDTGTIQTINASGGSTTCDGTNTTGTITTTGGTGSNNKTNTASVINSSGSGGVVSTISGGQQTMQTLSVKKEHDEMLSASSSNQQQTITVSIAPNQTQHTLVDASSIINSANNQQHIVTQHENTDGTTSLSFAQVQTVQGHPLTIGTLNQPKNHNILVKKVFILKGNNTNAQ